MTFLGVALSRMTLGVCKPPLADFGGREKREVFICHSPFALSILHILNFKLPVKISSQPQPLDDGFLHR